MESGVLLVACEVLSTSSIRIPDLTMLIACNAFIGYRMYRRVEHLVVNSRRFRFLCP